MFPAAIEAALLAHLPETIEVWRDPDITDETPNANKDEWGFPVTVDSPQAPGTGERKVDEMRGQIAAASLLRSSSKLASGATAGVPEQVIVSAEWVISVFEKPNLDIRLGDVLLMGNRRFSVLYPGGADSHCPLRLIWCQEVL